MTTSWPATVWTTDGSTVHAVVDDLPEFVGHGSDEDEACDDLEDQLSDIEWH